jgi:hypothetical protein
MLLSQGRQFLGMGLALQGMGGFPWVRVPGCHQVQFWFMLYLLFIESNKKIEKKKKGRNSHGAFFPGQTHPVSRVTLGFSQL